MKLELFFILFLLISCKNQHVYEVVVKEMTDTEYPDNPNLESRHSEAHQILFQKIKLIQNERKLFDLELTSDKANAIKIILNDLSLMEMIPTAPDCIKKDPYLTYITVINQEWNRQQVKFKPSQFKIINNGNVEITRVDIARNCLNAYLWEMLVYAKDRDGKSKLYWQGWFDFPHDLYKQLFEERSHLSFNIFQKGLENWIDPESKYIDLSLLRRIVDEKSIPFNNLNEEMYPLEGERSTKYKNIIFPFSPHKINDLLSDSTLFATFSMPGYYNKKDPRKTELSKLGILQAVIKRNVIHSLGVPTIELELVFLSNKDSTTHTHFILGGIDTSQIPRLSPLSVSEGWQTSMGVANHSFYESYDMEKSHLTQSNIFYTFLLDAQGKWIDSHKIGIDGPLLHMDLHDPGKLHLWILSFERHAFVGHYVLTL